MIDLTTLPNDVGVDKELVFYYDTMQNSDSRTLFAVTDVEVAYDTSIDGGVRVDIFNAYGETIKASYTITPDVVANAKSYVLASTYQTSGSVTVGNIVKYYDYTVENSGDKIELVVNALEANRISKEDALDLFLELWESGYSDGFCLTPLLIQIETLRADEAFVDQLSTTKQEALAAVLAVPMYIDERIYEVWMGYGYLDIHYEGDGMSVYSTPQAVYDIYYAFLAAYNLFVEGTFGFQQPETCTMWSYPVYDVYVAPSIGPSNGACYPEPDLTSSMAIWLSHDLDINITDTEWIIISHEYMHAIMNSYRFLNTIPWGQRWCIEAFAVWAEARHYGPIPQEHVTTVNAFLAQPSNSLPDNIYGYGVGILPLYIHTYFGGDITIERIIKKLPYVTLSGVTPYYTIYDAIDYGLSFRPYPITFKKLFPMFWSANYAPYTTYSAYTTPNWSAKPNIAATYPSYSLPNNAGPFQLNYYSCEFREFEFDPIQFTWDASVCVTVYLYSGSSSDLNGTVILSDAYGSTATVGDLPFYTIIYAWSDYVSGCVMISNNGTTGNHIIYNLTVDIYYG